MKVQKSDKEEAGSDSIEFEKGLDNAEREEKNKSNTNALDNCGFKKNNKVY